MSIEVFGEFLRLLMGTVIYRPYVYIFFICFLAFSVYQIGGRRTVIYTLMAWSFAFIPEYSSTRNGFPFGPYYYIDDTRTRELWISNVPFWDSLSFVFLSYFSFVLAAALLSQPKELNFIDGWSGFKSRYAPILGGFLMMVLDVVIDPVALRGDQWFLGKMYGYPYEGFYFGITLANFIGWWFVGAVTQFCFQKFIFEPRGHYYLPQFILGVFLVYGGVFGFNLFMTFWIGAYQLAVASSFITLVTMSLVGWQLNRLGVFAGSFGRNYRRIT